MSETLIKKLNAISHGNLSDPMMVRMDDWNDAIEEVRSVLAEVEMLRGRCGELEEFAAFAQQTAERELDPDYVPPRTAEAMLALLEASRQITGEVEACDYENPWLIRKQAEAVEDSIDCCEQVQYGQCPRAIEVKTLADYAQRLRQQAAESEGGNTP